jgi:hypothetical protein
MIQFKISFTKDKKFGKTNEQNIFLITSLNQKFNTK